MPEIISGNLFNSANIIREKIEDLTFYDDMHLEIGDIENIFSNNKTSAQKPTNAFEGTSLFENDNTQKNHQGFDESF